MRKRDLRIEDVRSLLDKRCEEAGGQRRFATAHGMSVQFVSAVSTGRKQPSPRLCKALGIKYDGGRWVKAKD